jgi:hypothetical protein
MKQGLTSVALILATFAGAAVTTEIADRKTLTLHGARRATGAIIGPMR